MAETSSFDYPGRGGKRVAQCWQHAKPAYIALLCHGYGEHIGRYGGLAERLVADDAVVYGVDHVGHGRSAGEPVLIGDFEHVVDDFHQLDAIARREHPDLPVVLIGHSMGGMIAARYAQRFGNTLLAAVLSGPVIGDWAVVKALLEMDPIPEVPIDITTLSRDTTVGEAYAADPLVWHGPFKRATLVALDAMISRINQAGMIRDVPVLWLHGGDDSLVPYDASASGWKRIAPHDNLHKIYPGARHEIFNETNRQEVMDDVVAFLGRYH